MYVPNCVRDCIILDRNVLTNLPNPPDALNLLLYGHWRDVNSILDTCLIYATLVSNPTHTLGASHTSGHRYVSSISKHTKYTIYYMISLCFNGIKSEISLCFSFY